MDIFHSVILLLMLNYNSLLKNVMLIMMIGFVSMKLLIVLSLKKMFTEVTIVMVMLNYGVKPKDVMYVLISLVIPLD
jgi:hypothetical protein